MKLNKLWNVGTGLRISFKNLENYISVSVHPFNSDRFRQVLKKCMLSRIVYNVYYQNKNYYINDQICIGEKSFENI